jgi:hypothetical protein
VEWSESGYSRDTAFRLARAGARVRISCADDACEVCKARAGKTYAPSDVPRLPVRGCMHDRCRCEFVAVDPESDMAVPQLVDRGVIALRAGNVDMARLMLRRAVALDEMYERGWLWLSGVVDDQEKIVCLRKVLAINPRNERAQAGLQRLLGQKAVTPEPALHPSSPQAISQPVHGAPAPIPAEVLELRDGRQVIVEQWSDFAGFALETDPHLVQLQGAAFLNKIRDLNDQALALVAPESELDELYAQWLESQKMGQALLKALRTHQSRRNHTPDWRAMYEALNGLGIELREHRNGLRVRILAAGGQVTES